MDQQISQAWTLLAEAGADPLEVALACESIVAFAHARQLDAMLEVSEQNPPGFDPTGKLCDPAPAEVACALAWTPAAASRRMDLAHDLHNDLPVVLDALRDGQIDLTKALEINSGTRELSVGIRAQLAQTACDYASTHTRGQLRAWLARQIAVLEPEAAQKRRRKARKQRRVWIQPEPDGMACLGAYLTAEEAQSCYQSLHVATANHEGGVDAARADEMVARLTGVSPAEPIPVQVLITPTGAELAGHGPVSADHAAELSKHADPTQLTPPTAMKAAYRPDTRLADWVRARDRHCRFPGCRRPAKICDLDHLIPWPDGDTTDQNLACLCRYHHRLKTHTNWQVRVLPGHTLEWTSPRGRTYTTTPEDP